MIRLGRRRPHSFCNPLVVEEEEKGSKQRPCTHICSARCSIRPRTVGLLLIVCRQLITLTNATAYSVLHEGRSSNRNAILVFTHSTFVRERIYRAWIQVQCETQMQAAILS
jgi:hypothetical protein